MSESVFEKLKRCACFTEQDVEHLRSLREPIGPYLAPMAEQFARRVLEQAAGSGPYAAAGWDRLREAIHRWLEFLFVGPYERQALREHMPVGRPDSGGLTYHDLAACISAARRALAECIRGLDLPDPFDKALSVHKVLDFCQFLAAEAHCEDAVKHIQASERREMQARLAEAEQLATIGQWAASLAHEIKNPLAGISGAIQVIGQNMAPDDPHKEVIEEILYQVDRLDAAVKDLLVYARPTPPQKRSCNLGELVQRVITLLREEPALRKVNLRYTPPVPGPQAIVDENQLQQVMANVLLNAGDACENGGTIEIRLDRTGDRVRLLVRDTGKGMTREVAERAFEPFFTTKAKGTGLGLPICKKIVEAHGGMIHIASEPNVGTEVRIELPAQAHEDAASVLPADAAGSETG